MSIKAIHTLKSKLGMSEGDYRELLMRAARVSSSKDLTERGDRAVMSELRRMEKERTAGIVGKIWGCWYELLPMLAPEQRDVLYLVGFLEKAHVEVCHSGRKLYLDRLSAYEANKAVEALKKRIVYEQSRINPDVPF